MESEDASVREMPELQIKNCKNDTDKSAEIEAQDLREPHTSKKEIRNTENSFTEGDSFVGRTRGEAELQEIARRAELYAFSDEERNVLHNCLHWLYYSDGLRIGICTYPQDYVREKLWQLNYETAENALVRMQSNQNEIQKNALVYTAKILFSCIVEAYSSEMLDPVINRLRRRRSGEL